jgi:hypothetical protein
MSLRVGRREQVGERYSHRVVPREVGGERFERIGAAGYRGAEQSLAAGSPPLVQIHPQGDGAANKQDQPDDPEIE